ncbi:MAG TPA: polysaccharide biosynthesis protein, partial [Flavisolibacter sp.]|nr:polysaccharide biosynthesis protein [Flavisolibacter sp.]
MGRKFIDFEASPQWVVQLIDLAILSVSFAFSYFFIKHFEFREIYRGHFIIYTGLFCIVVCFIFYIMRIHTGLIRYSNMQDIVRIFLALIISSLLYSFAVKTIVVGIFRIHSLNILRILFINFFVASSLLVLLRASIKEFFHFASSVASNQKEKVLIYGTDYDALLLKNALECVKYNHFNTIGFLDNTGRNRNHYIEQKKIFQLHDLPILKTKYQVGKLLLLNEQLGEDEKKRIIEQCLHLGIKLITVPPSDQWVCGQLTFSQMRELKVEDLLQRVPIVIHNNIIAQEIKNKCIVVTGAAGSIGSELVRQLLEFKPRMLILCDQAESFLNELHLEIKERLNKNNVVAFIGSVQNYKRMEVLFEQFQPEIVFHAAAYKHVPMMEDNPSEAVLNNVLGTKNMADLSMLFDIEKFILVSTDKAVNPTNVMGASKRIAEMYVQSLNSLSQGLVEDKDVTTA